MAEEDVAEEEKALRAFKRNHRKMRRNWDLPSKFPDIRVIDAYRKVGRHVRAVSRPDTESACFSTMRRQTRVTV